MCGLCGDYDGNPNNDFTKPDGSQTDSSSQFGDSWQTDEDEDATSVTFNLLLHQAILGLGQLPMLDDACVDRCRSVSCF